MTQNKLLVLSPHAADYEPLLVAANLPELSWHTAVDIKSAQPYLTECNIILGSPALVPQIINDAPNATWVQSTWAGVDQIVEAEGKRQNYQLTNIRDVFGPQISEYIFAYLILHVRKDWIRLQKQQEREWTFHLSGTLAGKTIGILGVGSIGAHVAETAKHFGMTVWGYTNKSENSTAVDRYFHTGELLDCVAGVDYLVNILPHTPSSQRIIDKSVFDAMKQDALFVNVGRGTAVDEDALVQALENEDIAGAVLDVFAVEPLPAEHPLWGTPNTIITSHTAAMSFPTLVLQLFTDNYQRFIDSQPFSHVVDFAKGY